MIGEMVERRGRSTFLTLDVAPEDATGYSG